MDKLAFNLCVAIHNLGLTADAEKLINNFITMIFGGNI